MRRLLLLLKCFLVAIILASCRDDVELFLSEEIELPPPVETGGYRGFYLLNEGNMGSNKSTLDFYDFATGKYARNIYAQANPSVPKELGDVGNDLQIYGSKLYAVINVSNKIEVMDARTATRVGQIEIPNCRYIQFEGKYAYVTSYAGPVEINPNYTQIGFVAKVDTATLTVVGKCLVGFQPDELAIVKGKIYVANSGGYMGAGSSENYERTVSVIDLERFTEEKRIDVAYNLHRIRADKRGNLWVSSRGDYKELSSKLFFIDTEKQAVTDTIDIPVSSCAMVGDSLYVCSVAWSYITYTNEITYAIINTQTHEVVTRNFITDGTEKEIEIPYGVMVHQASGYIFLTDAGNYVTPGMLYCFNKEGKKIWSVRTGDIPAHFALLKNK